MSTVSDTDLLSAWAAGDQEAYGALVARHHGLVRAACRRQAAPGEEDDCVQAVFLVLARRPAAAARAPALAAWLLRVATLVCRRSRRAAAARRRAERSAAELAVPAAAGPRPAALDHLDECLLHLPERQRAAVSLHYLAGKEAAEVAAALGTTRENAYMLLSRGLAGLRALLARRGFAMEAAVLAGLLTAEAHAAAEPAPAGIAATLVATPSPAAQALAGPTLKVLALKPILAVAACLLALLVLGGGVIGLVRAREPSPSALAATADAEGVLAALGGVSAGFSLQTAGEDLEVEVRVEGAVDGPAGLTHRVVGRSQPGMEVKAGAIIAVQAILTAEATSISEGRSACRASGAARRAWSGSGLRRVTEPQLDAEGRAVLAYRLRSGASATAAPSRADMAEAVVVQVREGDQARPLPAARFRAERAPLTTTALAWHLGLSYRALEVTAATAALSGSIEAYAAGRQVGAGSAPVPLGASIGVFGREEGAEMAVWLVSGGAVHAVRLVLPAGDPAYARDPRFRYPPPSPGLPRLEQQQPFHWIGTPGRDDRNRPMAIDDQGRIPLAVDWPPGAIRVIGSGDWRTTSPVGAYRAVVLRLTADGRPLAGTGPDAVRMVAGAIPDAVALARVLGLQVAGARIPAASAGPATEAAIPADF